MRKFALISLLKDIETITSEANLVRDSESEKKQDQSPVLESASRGKVRRPRRGKKTVGSN